MPSPRSPRRRPPSLARRPLSEADHPALNRIDALGYLLDDAIPIPGTGYRVGIDPLLGLLPGGGDMVGTLLSAYIVLEAARFRVPAATLLRMVFNIFLETVLGVIPGLGDLFDAAWKANRRNLRLLEAHLRQPGSRRQTDTLWVVLVLVLLGLLVAGVVLGYTLLLRWIVQVLGG